MLSADVLTFHNDLASTGVNTNETQLTPTNVVVNSFTKLFVTTVDGQVYAEPLVKTGVTIAGGPNTTVGIAGLHDVVYVATQHDSLYAIDASSTSSSVLWKRSFLDKTVAANNTFGATAINSVPNGDTGTGDIYPEVGITGTPVIDGSSETIFVVVKTKETINGANHYVQRLHAINASDGTDRTTPYPIGDTVNGNTNNTAIYVYGSGDGAVTDPYNSTGNKVVQFNALREHQRGALSLVNNTIYIPWASHGDNGPYHGWVVAWDVAQLATAGFVLKGVFNTSPNDGLSGIWQGGGRLAFEPDGSAFYFETGNGHGGIPSLNASGFPSDGNYNEALVKVVSDATTSPTHQNLNGWGLKVADYFIPFNVNALDSADSDFGSGGTTLLPDSAGIPGHPHLLVAGGKEGKLYLIDRDNLGKFSSSGDRVLNAVSDGAGHTTPPVSIGGLLSTTAYFNGKLYAVSGFGGQAKAFSINSNGTLSAVSQTAIGTFGYLPGSPSISANGTSNGIVWVADRNANQLHAYDATSLSTELWNSAKKIGGGDNVGAVNKFAVPTVANGRVYVGAGNSLVVYGLRQPPNAVPSIPSLTAAALSGSAIILTWTDTTTAPNIATIYVIEKSTDGTNFSQVATSPAGTNTLAIGGLQRSTHYLFRITGKNSVGSSNPSNVADATTTNQRALIDFSGGFVATANVLTLNGSTRLNGTQLQLTDTGVNEAGSAFSKTAVDVSEFTSQFNFQMTSGSNTADGFTFAIQGVGPTALGRTGGALGYGGIGRSAAIKFDLYNNSGEGVNSTGLFTNGTSPLNSGSVNVAATGLNFHSGHVFQVAMTYDGATLVVTITDTQTNQSATQNYTVNLPNILGGTAAYVGFTGATGGLVAVQDILNWTFSPGAAISPNPPSGLGATPTSATSIGLSWTSNSATQSGYHLDRATDIDFTENLITEDLPRNISSAVDTAVGLAPGNTFFYRLRAFNSVGDSDNSNTAQVLIPLAPPKPTLQQVDAVSDTQIAISWQDNAGHQADGYRILRAVNHGSFTSVVALPPTSRTAPSTYEWSDTGLTPGNTYEYHILAFNSSGNNDFAGVNATTITTAPVGVTALPGASVVELSWNAPMGAQSYNIYRGTTPGGEDGTPLATGITATKYSDTDVTIGVTYYYAVTAVNANVDHDPVLPAESPHSAEVSAIPTTYPGAPTGFTATTESNLGTPQVALNWNAAYGATSYNVYRSLIAGGEGGTPLFTGLVDNSFIDTAVSFGTKYFYQVTAVNADGEGPVSVEANAQPLFRVHINFTSTTGEAVSGYLADVGSVYDDRINDLVFGWTRDETANGVNQNAANSLDELHDSFHNLHGLGANNVSWKIAVPNGVYSVHLLAGDPNDTSSLYRITVGTAATGAVTVINGRASPTKRWLENTVTVTATNGYLTLNNGSSATNNKVAAIDITALTPSLTSTLPASGAAGRVVLLSGKKLTGASNVLFNGLPAAFTVVSSTRINATVPDNATTGVITVTTPGGTATSATPFKVAPRITNFAASSGKPGDQVVVMGANFTGTTSVKLNGLSAPFAINSTTQITLTVPVNATSGRITVTSSVGTATSLNLFVVAPKITSVSPTSGTVGRSVTLAGLNFTGATFVRIHGLEAIFAVLSATSIRWVVPSGATSGPISVTTAAGNSTTTADFIVN